jgi:hypothetical protein
MFGDRVLRKIIDSKREEATKVWRKIHNEKFYSLYSLENIVRLIR